jgi:hypothetical protein
MASLARTITNMASRSPAITDTHLEHEDLIAELSPEEYAVAEKKLLRKIDMRIMPCLFVIIIMK